MSWSTVAAPPPIAGTPTDPPPKDVPGYAVKIDEKSRLGGILLRAQSRYSYAKVGLLASGTAYYLLLTLFSLMAFAYGITTVVGAEELATRFTDTLSDALPGLVGSDGIDPETLRSAGRTAGIVGLLTLLYGSLRALGGATSSMHLIYGAPPNPRNFFVTKARFLLILIGVAPLILLSFASGGLTSDLMSPVFDAIGLGPGIGRQLVAAAGLVVGYLIDVLILWILLGILGGIRPQRGPRLIGALFGGLVVGVIKQLLEAIVQWVVDKPEYGAFAVPLAVLFVLSLLSQTLYGSAALTAGISDRNVPLQDLMATPDDVEHWHAAVAASAQAEQDEAAGASEVGSRGSD